MTSEMGRLQALLQECVVDGDFTFAGGQRADQKIECDSIWQAQGNSRLALNMLLIEIMMRQWDPAEDRKTLAIGGPENGALPIIRGLKRIWPRPLGAPTDRFCTFSLPRIGQPQVLQGDSLEKVDRILVVDDIATRGTSAIRVIRALHERYRFTLFDIVGVLTLVDRQDGALEALARLGVPLVSLFIARKDGRGKLRIAPRPVPPTPPTWLT